MSIFTEEFPLNEESQIDALLQKKHGDVVIMERKRIYPIWFFSKPRVRVMGYTKKQESHQNLDNISQKLETIQAQLTYVQQMKDAESGLSTIEDDLRTMGFSEGFIVSIIDHFKQTMTVSKLNDYKTLRLVLVEYLRQRMRMNTTNIEWHTAKGIVVFGNTGVGKTSILSKIAIAIKKHSFEQLSDVELSFVNHDTYKIGAMEQLESIATLLESQCITCTTVEDIPTMLRQRKKNRYLLIDTPGINPHSFENFDALQYYKDEKKILRFLILSAGISSDELHFTLNQYSQLCPHAVFVTKLDEAHISANVFASCIEHKIDIVYASSSPSFTKGLEKTTEQKILDILFHKTGHKGKE